jgi:hypothetical protein
LSSTARNDVRGGLSDRAGQERDETVIADWRQKAAWHRVATSPSGSPPNFRMHRIWTTRAGRSVRATRNPTIGSPKLRPFRLPAGLLDSLVSIRRSQRL